MPNPTSSVPASTAPEPREWKQKFEADDGTVYYDAEATREAGRHFDKVAAHNEQVLRRTLPQPPRTAPRPRGAGRPAVRRAAQRSSARSGDSGDSEGSEPPQGRRVNSRAEINGWAAERKRVLDALVLAEGLGQPQLGFDETEAA